MPLIGSDAGTINHLLTRARFEPSRSLNLNEICISIGRSCQAAAASTWAEQVIIIVRRLHFSRRAHSNDLCLSFRRPSRRAQTLRKNQITTNNPVCLPGLREETQRGLNEKKK